MNQIFRLLKKSHGQSLFKFPEIIRGGTENYGGNNQVRIKVGKAEKIEVLFDEYYFRS